MVNKVNLNVRLRIEKKGQGKKIRRDDFVPAVLYGPGFENINLKVKRKDLGHAYSEAGETNIVDLHFDDKKIIKAIIKSTQRNPIKDNIIHADLYRIDAHKQLEVEIPLNFINEAKAVKELGGTLVKSIESIHAKCLPDSLVKSVDVDLSVLNTFADIIRMKNLHLPAGIEISNSPEDAVAHVLAPKAVEVEKKAEEVVVEKEPAKDKKEEKK